MRLLLVRHGRSAHLPPPGLLDQEGIAAWLAAYDLAGIAATGDAAAPQGGTVVVVTHGVFRRLVGLELVRQGWRAEARRNGYAHWSVWGFRPPTTRA